MRVRSILGRVAVAAAALVVAAWLALGLQAAVLTEGAVDRLLSGSVRSPTPQQAAPLARAANDLDRAGLLNPDRQPDAYRARALAVLGDDRRARKLAKEVLREEPESLVVLGSVRAVGLLLNDRRLEAEARGRMDKLDPRGPSR